MSPTFWSVLIVIWNSKQDECNANRQHLKTTEGPFYGGSIYKSQFKDYI